METSKNIIEKDGEYYIKCIAHEEVVNRITKKLHQQLQKARQDGYNAGLADGTGKPLLAIEQKLHKAREEERERVNKILAGHGKGCDPRYHAECIEMIYEEVNQSELDQPNK
jgi:flagellar biosynthesis/type III secretory pathway protein FliH